MWPGQKYRGRILLPDIVRNEIGVISRKVVSPVLTRHVDAHKNSAVAIIIPLRCRVFLRTQRKAIRRHQPSTFAAYTAQLQDTFVIRLSFEPVLKNLPDPFLLLFSVGSHKPEVITVPEVQQDATVVVHVSRRSCQVHVQQYSGGGQGLIAVTFWICQP
ncbi:hypothetical protein KIH13_22320 [Pseudomonas viridiflava]|nr:hypothetical protein KIH13_22320 [Pseudomonas viridiflava]